MTQKKIRAIGAGALVALWLLLTAFSWFAPATEFSKTERRPLAQSPELSWNTFMDGSFMKNFEVFTQDQYPLRDTFRQAKSLFLFYVLNQTDKDGLYLQDGYLADMEYKLDQAALESTANKITQVYDMALSQGGGKIYLSIVPDKNIVLSRENGRFALDMGAMESYLLQELPWATYIDISGTLSPEDYYYTDTHWRQEMLIPTAAALCEGMGVKAPLESEYSVRELDTPFYGVYYGQVMAPVQPDTLKILENDMLSGCKVTDIGSTRPKTTGFHNLQELPQLKDPYDMFLYGFQYGFTVVENPNALTDKTLFVFRDSFGCSIAPLLVENYKNVVFIDLRSFSNPTVLTNPMFNGRYWNLENADSLFLLSTLVINNPDSFGAE